MTKIQEKPHILLIGFCVAICIVGAFGEVATIQMFFRAYHASSWPSVEGTVLRSELKSEFVGKMKYTAEIEYEYSVNGIFYRSTRIRERGNSNQHKTDIEAVVEKYPVGKKVQVYYDESDHSKAFLDVQLDFVYFVLIISPLVFSILFGFGAWELIKKRREFLRRESSN